MRIAERAAHEYTETWCIDGEIGHAASSGGGRVRYLRVGNGPPLILLHTIRTQLDHFQLVIPRIAHAFTVYAVDFPGNLASMIAARARYAGISVPVTLAYGDEDWGRPVPVLAPRIPLRITERPLEGDRVPGEGTVDQIRGDVAALEALGAAYVVLDPFVPRPDGHAARLAEIECAAAKVIELR